MMWNSSWEADLASHMEDDLRMEATKMANANKVQQAMTVRNHAAALLVDHENEPVDASSLARETGLTEKQVTQSLKYLVREDLIEMDGGKVIAVLPMFTEAQQ